MTPELLTAAIVVPAVGALLVAMIPRSRGDLAKMIALVASSIVAIITIQLLLDFDRAESGFQFVTDTSWISELGIRYHIGVDGISLFLVVLAGILFPLAIAGIQPHHDPKPYYAWLLVLQAGSIGSFVALDLFLFFVFFEIVLVPMYMLIAGWGHGNRTYAALKFFLYTMAGSALMLVGIVALAVLHSRAAGTDLTFDVVEIAENLAITRNQARWIFAAFAAAFAVKVPLFPIHTWLPDAHTEAPTAGSVILAGVMLKLGTYGLLRFGVYLFPEASNYFAPVLMTLGVIGIIYGAIAATMQTDLKRLVAYSSIAHLGFIVLGIFSVTSQGLTGSVAQMVNHGISTGALFILVGLIYERRHTREIAELGGLQKAAPLMAAVFMVIMLSSIGLPGLNGFVGEFLILVGSFATARWWTVVAAGGVILAALYLLWAYQRVFHGPAQGDNATMKDLRVSEILTLAPFVIAAVFLGIYPKPMLERIEPSVERVIERVESQVEDFDHPDFASKRVDPATVASHDDDSHGEDSHGDASHGDDSSGTGSDGSESTEDGGH